jgi:hypothetical protein
MPIFRKNRDELQIFNMLKDNWVAGCWWLMPEILPTQETEIRRIKVQS